MKLKAEDIEEITTTLVDTLSQVAQCPHCGVCAELAQTTIEFLSGRLGMSDGGEARAEGE